MTSPPTLSGVEALAERFADALYCEASPWSRDALAREFLDFASQLPGVGVPEGWPSREEIAGVIGKRLAISPAFSGEIADAILALFPAAPQVPEGWRAVPCEPTGLQIATGAMAADGSQGGRDKARRVYHAMLSSAPPPDTAPADESNVAEHHVSELADALDRAQVFSPHPQPVPIPEAEIAEWKAELERMTFHFPRASARRLIEEVERLRTKADNLEYLKRHAFDDAEAAEARATTAERKLDEAREALAELVRVYELGDFPTEFKPALEQARAALSTKGVGDE